MLSKRKWLLIFVVLLMVIGVYYLFANKFQLKKLPIDTISPSTNIDRTDWKTYTDNKYSFSFKYPKDWQLDSTDYDNGNSKLIVIDPVKSLLGDLLQSGQSSHQRAGLIYIQIEELNNAESFISSRGYAKFPDKNISLHESIQAKRVEEYTPKNAVNNPNEHYIGYVFTVNNIYFYTISFQANSSQEKYISNFEVLLSTFQLN